MVVESDEVTGAVLTARALVRIGGALMRTITVDLSSCRRPTLEVATQRRGSLILSLIHVRVPRSITGRRRAPSRGGDQHGQPWTVIRNPEKSFVPWGDAAAA